jgi:carbonic anhydrase/acetyltransferase-like protein (isoleucine patch superfamily)
MSYAGKIPEIAAGVFIEKSACVIGDVSIGADSSIWFNCVIRGDVNYIRIGTRTNIQDACVVHVTSRTNPTIIGDEVTVGHRVVLHGCRIGSRSLIGIGAIILDGVVIGEGSIIGAGALITHGKEIPDGSVVVGNPSRISRHTTTDDDTSIEHHWRHYLEYKNKYLAGVSEVIDRIADA